MTDIKKNIYNIKESLDAKPVDNHQKGKLPTVIAVSKKKPQSVILEAIDAGITHFGENRIQEAQEKWPAIKQQYPELTLHYIGQLQSNKAKEAVSLCDVIHTVDRTSIIKALAKAETELGMRRDYFIQVNVGEEEQKGGCLPSQLGDTLTDAQEAGLHITGLMCLPPPNTLAAPYFALMQKLAERHELAELSMGMSHDYEMAARFGATYLRIGTALLGAR